MGEPLRDPHGKIIQWYGLAIDIDEPKRAEDHLRDMRIKLARASQIATVAELSASIADSHQGARTSYDALHRHWWGQSFGTGRGVARS
jgi:hypothetical protein